MRQQESTAKLRYCSSIVHFKKHTFLVAKFRTRLHTAPVNFSGIRANFVHVYTVLVQFVLVEVM